MGRRFGRGREQTCSTVPCSRPRITARYLSFCEQDEKVRENASEAERLLAFGTEMVENYGFPSVKWLSERAAFRASCMASLEEKHLAEEKERRDLEKKEKEEEKRRRMGSSMQTHLLYLFVQSQNLTFFLVF